MSVCKSCGAEIVWATTGATGKKIPLDARPLRGVFRLHGPGPPPIAEAAGGIDELPLHVSHFATCPNADEHRKEKS